MDKIKYEFALMVIAIGAVTVVTLTYLIAKAIREHRAAPANPPDPGLRNLSVQLDSMQQQLDAMHVEIERVAEGQRFTMKMLSERSSAERIGG